MIYRTDNIRLSPGESEKALFDIARRKLRTTPAYFRILKKSLDARNKNGVFWQYSIEYSAEDAPILPPLERCDGKEKIIVVGSGPAGLFCALRLVDRGFRPIVVERGECVEARERTVRRFFDGGSPNPDSNVQFGEGGAGTFSDGKLNTGTHSGYNRDVLRMFVRYGADEEAEYLNKPHIGSDRLKTVVANMRNAIVACGGEVRFHTRMTGLIRKNGKVCACLLRDTETGSETEESADAVVLAVGHSARDTFVLLRDTGLAMERREFAVGVRIEHLQKKINRAQYGDRYPMLPPADYKAVSHAGERAAFTFCMCPGGYVVPAASEENGVVTNGMSNHARDGENANSGLLVQIRASDFASDDVLAGVEFQRKIERAAFRLGGNSYAAPVQLVGDFLSDTESKAFGDVRPTYARGTVFAPLRELFSVSVVQSMKAAITDIGRRICGFDDADAVMTGAETRFSSPLRILRGENLESVSMENLYPCGEGCGYSGGITSSAADGIRVADRIFRKFYP